MITSVIGMSSDLLVVVERDRQKRGVRCNGKEEEREHQCRSGHSFKYGEKSITFLAKPFLSGCMPSKRYGLLTKKRGLSYFYKVTR
jgi:hypothetical protein